MANDGDLHATINSWLMSGRGAEVFFARSVLLVEGPGDREFFEALRRRLARYDKTGSIDHCYVVNIGTNGQFAPWLKLVRAYSPPAFSWLGVLDSDMRNEIVRDTVSHAGLHFSARQTGELDAVKAAIEANDLGACEAAARRLAKLAVGETPLLLAPGDLEYVMTSRLSNATATSLGTAVSLSASTAMEMAERLGTKHRVGGKAVEGPNKKPWIRRHIGQKYLPRSSTSSSLVCSRGGSPVPATRRRLGSRIAAFKSGR